MFCFLTTRLGLVGRMVDGSGDNPPSLYLSTESCDLSGRLNLEKGYLITHGQIAEKEATSSTKSYWFKRTQPLRGPLASPICPLPYGLT